MPAIQPSLTSCVQSAATQNRSSPLSKRLSALAAASAICESSLTASLVTSLKCQRATRRACPPEYERRQTLTNSERYTTPELRDWEKKVLGAEERIIQLEAELFNDVCRQVAAETKRIQATARALAALDALGLARLKLPRAGDL